MKTKSLNLRTGNPVWLSSHKEIENEALTMDEKCDVLIVGAGITGAMAAEEMVRLGFSVIILDKRGPLKGSTAATTALLQYVIDVPLSKLVKNSALKELCELTDGQS